MLNSNRLLFKLKDQPQICSSLLFKFNSESFLNKKAAPRLHDTTNRNFHNSSSLKNSATEKKPDEVSSSSSSSSLSTASQIKTEWAQATEKTSTIIARQMQVEQERVQDEMKRVASLERQKPNLVNMSPAYMADYLRLMRLDKPSPIYLVYWPSAWAILGAGSYLGHALPDLYMLGLFAVGATAMRSAGCIINDMWDRKLDRKVERTKDRPLASGRAGIPAATALLAANLSVSLAVLMQLDLTTQILGACALFPVAVYPAAKRFTNWPQAVLGVTFNWGALMGWSTVLCTSTAVANLNLFSFLPAFVLYAGCINWTLFYDTIYAYQDKEHDERAGVKSTAITLEKRRTLWLLGFSTACVSNLALFGYLTSQEPIFYITLGLTMAHFLKQMAFVNFKSPESCARQFKSNSTIGALVGFGLLASMLIK
jgi:4-hydroxybenzoate polyprenyltransferase